MSQQWHDLPHDKPSIFSFSCMTIERRSVPIKILSSPPLILPCPLLLFTLYHVASLTKFVKSAPEKPGVPAILATLTQSPMGTFSQMHQEFARAHEYLVMAPPLVDQIDRRKSVGSNTSGRLVAVQAQSRLLSFKPSISTSN